MATAQLLRNVLEEHTMTAASALTRPGKGQALRCLACGHRCLIREGRAGVCKVRFNRDGVLRVPGGYVAGLQVDPIEKKPFYHAYPGRHALSFGMLGCDLHCSYCQNWVTSQALRDPDAVAFPRHCDADQLVEIAIREGAPVVVSTYNEPLITADWAVKVFEKACEKDLVCGFVSNGNATPEVIEFIKPFVSLYKVDLKGFNDKRYRSLGCKLKSVMETIERLKASGFWVEIVTLIVPGFNDDDRELRAMAEFIASISHDIPWHVTAFHPDYKMMGHGRTEVRHLDVAYVAGKEAGLSFVYPGNMHGHVGEREHTHCPECGHTVIRRQGFYVLENLLQEGRCPHCAAGIPGVWEASPPPSSEGSGYPRALRL